MSLNNRFISWEEAADYIKNVLGIEYLDDPAGWVDAMKNIMKNRKYVDVLNETTGEVHGEYMYTDDMVIESGEWYIPGETSGTTPPPGSTSGAKSAPTVQSVITDSSGGGSAVVGDDAIGTKTTGLLERVKGINILNGLLAIYGLVSTGIQIANAQVWKDMSNYVYGSNFTDEDPVERVIDFLVERTVSVVSDITSDGYVVVNIPDTIAERMYNFLANHMVSEEVPGVQIYLPDATFMWQSFIQRTWQHLNPRYSMDRWFSVNNPEAPTILNIVPPSDDLIKAIGADFLTSVIGSGFSLSNQVGAAFLAAMDGIMQYALAQSVGAVNSCKFCCVYPELYRGSTPPPKSTPVSLSELKIQVDFVNTFNHIEIEEYGDEDAVINADFETIGPVDTGLFSGEARPPANGDFTKYLKRGRSGEAAADYGYKVRPSYSGGLGDEYIYTVVAEFPSNEKVLSYGTRQGLNVMSNWGYVNGIDDAYTHTIGDDDYYFADFYSTGSVSDGGLRYLYSNIGYRGHGESYGPDDYLTTAGIRTRVVDGRADKNPSPNETKEQRYPHMRDKKQGANASVRTDTQTGEQTVINHITEYVRVPVPFGSENAERIIDHGYNNPDDPDSYFDNRSQDDLYTGEANRDDPIDGFNEDTERAIDDFNDSKTDPEHFPEEIPGNQPVPQYPVNPPSDSGGDSGETPDPSAMEDVTASGMCSVYNPTKAEVVSFSGWLWSRNFLDNFLKIFTNPMDAIISLHIIYATPETTTPSNIIVGYLDSGVSAKVVDQQFTEIDCGSVYVPEYYGTAIDYEPYTQVHCYLPFVGIVSLKPNDVLGKTLTIKYGIDVLTGTCLATLYTSTGEDDNIACYNFAGNCSTQVPLSGGSYAQMITGLAGFLVGGVGAVATANPLAALGAAASLMNTHLDVAHSGQIGANAGAMGIRKPYLIITRKSAYEAANYANFYGMPANKTVRLGSCSGFTRVKSVHIDSIGRATDNEKREIETLLKEGVIIR